MNDKGMGIVFFIIILLIIGIQVALGWSTRNEPRGIDYCAEYGCSYRWSQDTDAEKAESL